MDNTTLLSTGTEDRAERKRLIEEAITSVNQVFKQENGHLAILNAIRKVADTRQT